VKEVWNKEMAELTFSTQTSTSQPQVIQTNTDWQSPSLELDEDGCWFGIEHRDSEKYSEQAQAFLQTKPTGFVESDAQELMRLATAFNIGYDVMLEGPKGCGKTMSVLEMGYRTGIPVIRFNCSEGITEEDFIGYRDIVNGNTVWVDGLAPIAAREGCMLYPDETNGARPNIMLALHQMMDNRKLVLPTGEVIECHDDFMVIGSMNPPDDYAGVTEMNQATRDRFGVGVNFKYLPEMLEARVCQEQSGVMNAGVALELVKFANDLRILKAEGSIGTDTSTRMLCQVMALTAHWSVGEAVRFSMLGKYPTEERDDVEMAARARLSDY
jgi:MoxR-like ATPase